MSAIKVNGTWQRVSSIKIKQNGAWVDHASLYAKVEGAWHLIDLGAEPLDPAYHVWKAYADSETGEGISLDPTGKIYIGFATGRRTEEPDLSDPTLFDWSLIKGEDGQDGQDGQDVDESVLNDILEKQEEFPVLVDDVDSRLKAADVALSNSLNTLDLSIQAQSDLIDTLDSTLSSNTGELAALDSRVTNSVSSVNASIDAVALDLGGVKDDVTGLVSLTSGNESKIADLETITDEQAQRVTILETSSGSSKSRIASLESTSAEQATRLSSLGVWDGESYASITSLEEATATNASSISSLETSNENSTSRISSLEETEADHATRLTSVETESANNTSKVNTLEQTSDGHASRLTNVETKATIAVSDASDAQDAADSANTRVTATTNRVSSLEETTGTHASRLTNVETKATIAVSDASDAQDAADSANEAIATTTNRVSSLEETSGTHASRLTNVETKATTAESKADNAQDDADDANAAVTATTNRVSSLEETTGTHASRLTNVETKATTAESKADDANTAITATTNRVSSLEETTGTHASRLTNVETKATTAVSKADNAQDDADDANAAIATTTNRVSSLEETTGTHASRLTNVETTASTAVSDASDAQEAADNAQDDADTANSRVTSATNRVSTLEQTTGTHASRLTNVETKATTAVSKADNAQDDADTANTKAENAQDDADTANSRVTATTNRVSTLEETTGTHASRLTNVETTAGNAEADSAAAQAAADLADLRAGSIDQIANLLPLREWKPETSGTTGSFDKNGPVGANSRRMGVGPYGSTVLWVSESKGLDTGEGGWIHDQPSDSSETYRLLCWFKRDDAAPEGDGKTYLGTGNCLKLNGGANSNPYFYSISTSSLRNLGIKHGEWFCIVGHMHPHDYTGGKHPDSGLYNERGEKLAAAVSDFKFKPSATDIRHRAYYYYENVEGATQIFAEPRVEIVDGTELPIKTVLTTVNKLASGANELARVADNKAQENSSRVSTLEQTTGTHASRLTNVETKATTAVSDASDAQNSADNAQTDANAAQTSADNAQADADNAQADADTANSRVTATTNRVSTLEQTTGTHASRLTNVETKSNSNASKVSTLEETTADNASRIETVNTTQGNAVASAIDTARAYTDSETGELRAERVIKADANGKVSGIHLLANGSGAEAGGKMYFQADEIAIVPPNWNPSSEQDKRQFPFYFSNDRKYMYLDEAVIKALSAETIDSGSLAVDGLTLLSKDLSLPAGTIRDHMIDPAFKDGLVRVNPDGEILGGTESITEKGVGFNSVFNVPTLKSGGSAQTLNIEITGPNVSGLQDVSFDLTLKLNGAHYNFTSGSHTVRLSSSITGTEIDGGDFTYTRYRTSFHFDDQIVLPAPTKGNNYTYQLIVSNPSFGGDGYASKLSVSATASEPTVSSGGFITDVRWGDIKEKPTVSEFDSYEAGYATQGWVTVAEATGSRGYADVFVWDKESGDHSFLHMDVFRSYRDQGITVVNSGGHQQRITGARWIRESDTTYGKKKLQVYVTTSSTYRVMVKDTEVLDGYSGAIKAVKPSTEGTPSGYYSSTSNEITGMSGGGGTFAVSNKIKVGSHTVWHSGNDGSGSGLDADKLDGFGTSQSTTANTVAVRNSSGDIRARLFRSTFGNGSDIGGAIAYRNDTSDNYIRFCSDMGAVRNFVDVYSKGESNSRYATSGHGHTGLDSNSWGGIKSQTSDGYISLGPANSSVAHIYTDRPKFYFNKQLTVNGDTVWNSGNDGSGSGLDADKLDGLHASSFGKLSSSQTWTGTNVFNKLKVGSSAKIEFANNDAIRYDDSTNIFHFDRDGGSSNAILKASKFEGTATNATDADKSTLLRSVDSRSDDDDPRDRPANSLSFDFKYNSKVGNPPTTASSTYSHIITVAGWDTSGSSGGWPSQLSVGRGGLAIRSAGSATAWSNWNEVWHTGNDSVLARHDVNNIFEDDNYFKGVLASKSPNGAIHRLDTRDDGNYGRGHWYGKTSSGGTASFKEAWYDGSSYVNVDVSSQTVTFDGSLRFNGSLYSSGYQVIKPGDTWYRAYGSDGLFFSDFGGGLYMVDSSFVRVYSNKGFRVSNSWTNAVSVVGGGVTADKGYRCDNKGTSWITQKDSTTVPVYSDNTNNGAYAAMIRQRHSTITHTVGGIGNGQFGFHAYYNSRTENGTDGSFSMDIDGNCKASGEMEATKYSVISDNDESQVRLEANNGRYCRMFFRGSDSNWGLYMQDANGSIGTRVRWSGDLRRWSFYDRVYAPDFISTSDRRVKSNIKPIDNALEKVGRLSGNTYTRDDQNGEKSAGVIAQEVEAVLPELVKENEGTKRVAHNGLIGLLVEAVKELTAKVEKLEGASDV